MKKIMLFVLVTLDGSQLCVSGCWPMIFPVR